MSPACFPHSVRGCGVVIVNSSACYLLSAVLFPTKGNGLVEFLWGHLVSDGGGESCLASAN